MADMYDSELNAQLDQQIPIRHFVRRQRPSDHWFDKECRAAKRLTRRLERSFSSATVSYTHLTLPTILRV